ncbi:TetR/AcrR family transcriptional regulator [Shewanella sp. SP1S1-7]|uniref:TetR/AcrR family transcriptional regulator n=1 Tax=Shewanella septentrionalis TaxID=2952223 RepID=A0A9X3B2C4_9GAMM|nr:MULTISPECIES: TetR/AcrR family transcriptional regulator [Shewanella]MCT7947989.1 TetR/AcrR family transcriptional regulator [Shewanella septentrionalis]MDT3337306.1 TetR/AcrR family transcriptional regulator [Shewanella sp. SP1S1-7]
MLSKRDRILEAAEKIVVLNGFDGLSMQLIAKEAGISAGTIYLHFTCKDDLIISLREKVITTISQKVLGGIKSENSSWDNYRIVWFNILTLAKERNADQLSFEQYLKIPGTSDEKSNEYEKLLFSPLYDLYQKAIIKGEIIDIGINYLIALSLESAVALARYLRRDAIEYDAIQLNEICRLSWRAICVNK